MAPTAAWSGLELEGRLSGGARTDGWRGRLRGERVVVRRSRRSPASLEWELGLMAMLAPAGFLVPEIRPADDGRSSVEGVVVQSWIDGREPSSTADWSLVASELQRLHAVAAFRTQRPECCVVTELTTRRRSVDADLDVLPAAVAARVVAAFAACRDAPVAVVHGDPGPANIRMTDDGRVGLLDWDESRVDLVWHDLSNLGVQVLDDETHARAERLSHAWEAANAWLPEPDYARRRLDQLS